MMIPMVVSCGLWVIEVQMVSVRIGDGVWAWAHVLSMDSNLGD
jgi:hypothetical protein